MTEEVAPRTLAELKVTLETANAALWRDVSAALRSGKSASFELHELRATVEAAYHLWNAEMTRIEESALFKEIG
ncbi:MAG: hypothetical protein JWO45_166 [Spartobacteria bacterium]|nr:hypothetical protein [Spartobacteria bacterium]